MNGGTREPAHPAQSNELLGLPRDARVLIINADDFGMYPAVNAAVVRSIEEGIASSCSLMTPCPAAPQAMDLLRQHPRISFGIHLTLVCDIPSIRWGPLAAREEVSSLLSETGELFTPAQLPGLLVQARLDEVELEFRAQINAVADAGLTPTHLDWHCLADGGRDDIFDLTVALASEYGLAVRAWLEPARRKLRQRNLTVIDHEFLDSFRPGRLRAVLGVKDGVAVGLSPVSQHGDRVDQGTAELGELVFHSRRGLGVGMPGEAARAPPGDPGPGQGRHGPPTPRIRQCHRQDRPHALSIVSSSGVRVLLSASDD